MKMPLRSALLVTATVAVFSSASVADSAAIVAELKNCARIVANDVRIACYETLGKQVIQGETTMQTNPKPEPGDGTTSAETVSVGTAATKATSTAAAPETTTASAIVAPGEQPRMTDSMGGYKFEEKPSDHPDNDIHTRVVRCQQNINKEWYFEFENGQVWKQVDRNRRHFKACDFAVVVSEDGFGYVMRVEGKDWKIRISRRK